MWLMLSAIFLASLIFAFGSFQMISSLCFVVNVVWLMSLVSGVAETLKALIILKMAVCRRPPRSEDVFSDQCS